MTKPSDELKSSGIYDREPVVKVIHERYEKWTPEAWAKNPAQLSFDMGALLGTIMKLDTRIQALEQNNRDLQRLYQALGHCDFCEKAPLEGDDEPNVLCTECLAELRK